MTSRSFDGTNDNIKSANNALGGVDVSQVSFGLYLQVASAPAAAQVVTSLLSADGAGGQLKTVGVNAPTTSGFKVQFIQRGATNGEWRTDDVTTGVRHYVTVTYDRALVTNDPVITVDGVVQTLAEITTPVTITTGDDTLKLGENAGGTGDFAGLIEQCAIEGGVLWDAATKNRAMWWGRPHGGQESYVPFITTKLVDDGASQETLTATGTTMGTLVTPCVRPGSAGLGMGVGW